MTRIHSLKWVFALVLTLGLMPAAALAAPDDGAHGATAQAAQAEQAAETHGADAGDGHAEQPPLLNVAPGMYFWQVLLFLVLLAVLAKFVWPHILQGLRDREEKQRNDLAQAEQQRKEAEASLQQYKQQLAEARKEAQQIVEQSRSEAQKVGDELKAQANQEIQQMRQRAQRDIENAKQQAVSDVYDRTAELATHIAGRILQREISPDDQKALVEQSLNEMAQAQGETQRV